MGTSVEIPHVIHGHDVHQQESNQIHSLWELDSASNSQSSSVSNRLYFSEVFFSMAISNNGESIPWWSNA